jgi:Transposase DDE domain
MFLKIIYKGSRLKGNEEMHFRMVESYRYGNTVKHQNIIHLGKLEDLEFPKDHNSLARRIDELVKEQVTGQKGLFVCENKKVEQLAQYYVAKIIAENKIDITKTKNYELIDTENISNHDAKEIGGEWLCHETLNRLNLSLLLKSTGKFSEEEIKLAYTHIISKAVNPASELATSKWIKDNSAVCEVTGYPVHKITKDKLYGISLKLYECKEIIEQHLSIKTNELFDIEDKIIIYDLTNTYFEGKQKASKLSDYGRSKEKRNDCKLVVLGVVVNEKGFIKYSKIFEGKTSDINSLEKIIEDLVKATSHIERKPIIVMDAGISSEDNLRLLKQKGYSYMCVSRSGLTKYKIDDSRTPIKVQDNKGQEMELQKVTIPKQTDTFLRVNSYAKNQKEHSMNEQFKTRFEVGLEEIKASLSKKSGTKTLKKVAERLGRLKQKYPSINKYYEINIIQENLEENVKDLSWKMKKQPENEGVYLLRTDLKDINEKVQWTVYNVIREIESTFRVLKTDLDLRPIYHKSDIASMAHLHLGLLAYTLVNTIRHQLKQNNNNSSWRDIVRIMNTQKAVSTRMEGPEGKVIVIRKCTEPIAEVISIYKALNIEHRPFKQKKFVVPPKPKVMETTTRNQQVNSG